MGCKVLLLHSALATCELAGEQAGPRHSRHTRNRTHQEWQGVTRLVSECHPPTLAEILQEFAAVRVTQRIHDQEQDRGGPGQSGNTMREGLFDGQQTLCGARSFMPGCQQGSKLLILWLTSLSDAVRQQAKSGS